MLYLMHYYSSRMLNLNLEMVQKLDAEICKGYQSWVRRAPAEYKDDNFFLDRVPVVITSRYGQNNRFGQAPDIERDNWERDRVWSKIRFVTVALATHLW